MHALLYPVRVISLWPHFLLTNSDGFVSWKQSCLRVLKSGRAAYLRGIRSQWPQAEPKLGTFVGCISQEMSFSMSSTLAPNVGTNPVLIPSTTQNLNPFLYPVSGPGQTANRRHWHPPNSNSAHQLQLSQGVFLTPAVPQAQGPAYQPGS